MDRILEFRRYDGEMVQTNVRGILVASHHDVVFWTICHRKHVVRYGLQVKTFLGSVEAAEEFGSCVRHAAECDGLFGEEKW